ncbi:MAG: DUF1501 domain-containing protein [Fimbriiglobus sp.]|jgi:uncharacterized protein (DUF1501 family)|nr:DUF1501 domain-containing protein [Fimbriiglobus sp.]
MRPRLPCGRGISRRSFVVAGAGLAGLTLTDLLCADAEKPKKTSPKSILNIHLDGGPPQHDTIDPKPDAPEEVRGPLKAIPTKLHGVHLCELMPRVAALADRFVFLRSLVGSTGFHDAFQTQAGFHPKNIESVGGRPAMGSVVAKLFGKPSDTVPPFVDLMQGRPLVRNSARPGYLGPAFAPFRPDLSAKFPRELEEGMKVELQRGAARPSLQLDLVDGLTPDRLADRQSLLEQFDDVRREVDQSGTMDALDQFGQQAVSILTSGRLAKALSWDDEPESVVKMYTPPASKLDKFETGEDEHSAKKLLLARRLLEAGVRCVSVSFSDFDTHSQNFPRMRKLVPIVDHALAALVTDLSDRGMLDDVAIVVWGEFGRTPKVAKDGGRDHWPEVGPALLAGAGWKAGQVIGATDRIGGRVTDRPVSYEDVFATLYATLGVDARKTHLKDPSGRPQSLLDAGQVIRELV